MHRCRARSAAAGTACYANVAYWDGGEVAPSTKSGPKEGQSGAKGGPKEGQRKVHRGHRLMLIDLHGLAQGCVVFTTSHSGMAGQAAHIPQQYMGHCALYTQQLADQLTLFHPPPSPSHNFMQPTAYCMLVLTAMRYGITYCMLRFKAVVHL